jgi:hypothetical protein
MNHGARHTGFDSARGARVGHNRTTHPISLCDNSTADRSGTARTRSAICAITGVGSSGWQALARQVLIGPAWLPTFPIGRADPRLFLWP